MAAQNFGSLDNLVTLSNDNSISISDFLDTGTQLTIDNDALGVADIKQEIADTGVTFNNFYEPTLFVWILATGFWNDQGTWIDTETWID